MTYREFYKKIEDAYIKYVEDGDLWDIGIRFENRAYNVGDTVANSKHNPDREDERDFPVYGTPEYDELPELDGACAYLINHSHWQTDTYVLRLPPRGTLDDEIHFYADHCHIIHSNYRGSNETPDIDEVVYTDAVVLEVIY